MDLKTFQLFVNGGFVGDATFDSSGKSMRRKVQRARKKQEKLLNLCLVMLVCYLPRSVYEFI